MIQMFHVSKAYPGDPPVLTDINLDIDKAEFVFLTGPSGAGKSTLLKLMFLAERPSKGQILIAGRNIARVRESSIPYLRRNIGVVFQEPGLFYRSIGDNLRVANPDATQAEIEAAARAAEAHNFISAKADGYDTLVAERGRSLSGGERQRLAIARAMLKDAPILILDEATSALDNGTEARIQKALTGLSRGRTTFVIAHRLSTVRNADLILVLDQGRLVESGRFEELVAQGGLFAELADQGKFAPDAVEETPPGLPQAA